MKRKNYERPTMKVVQLNNSFHYWLVAVVISPIVIHTHLGAIPSHSKPYSVEPIKMKRQ